MAMTKREYAAKRQVMDRLNKQGYPTYSKLLDLFDLNLTKDPEVIGYMEPGKARIVINENLNIDDVSVVVRHEILHEYLTHHKRLLKHLAAKAGLDYDKLDDNSLRDLDNKLFSNQIFNIAADYEISNRGYTDADKNTIRNLKLNDQLMRGLVTEDDHPDWIDLSVEEMYDKLSDEYDETMQALQDFLGNLGPQIGGVGNSDIQQAEQIEREANDISDQLQGSGGGSGNEDDSSSSGGPSSSSNDSDKPDKNKTAKKLKDKFKDIADAAGDLADEAKEAQQQSDQDGPLKSKADQQKQAKITARLNKIKEIFDDAVTAAETMAETDYAISKEKMAKAAIDADEYRDTPLNRFTTNLNNFIKKATATGRGPTWSRINKKYARSGIIKPGTSRLAQAVVPSINVYFDRSGSWDDEKIKVGEQAIATLNKYVKRGQIKINLFYFSQNVHDNKKACEREGGTNGQPILDHIEATKPDNVIVMTDDDIRDCRTQVSVPGAVWFLFKGGESENIQDHLFGKKETKKFELD